VALEADALVPTAGATAGAAAGNRRGRARRETAEDDDSALGWITTVAVLLAAVLLVGATTLWVFGRQEPQDLGGSPLVYPSTSLRRTPATNPTTIAPRQPTTTDPATPGPTAPDPANPDPANPDPANPGPGASTIPASAWTRYISPDGALEADFPAAPTTSPLQDVTTCALSGNQVQQDDGQSVYVVTYGLTQPDCVGGQLTSELLHAAVGTLGPSGQILNVREGRFKDHTLTDRTMTGFDLSAGTNDIKGRGAIIVTPGHYFLVIAAGPSRRAVEFERFLSSLRVS